MPRKTRKGNLCSRSIVRVLLDFHQQSLAFLTSECFEVQWTTEYSCISQVRGRAPFLHCLGDDIVVRSHFPWKHLETTIQLHHYYILITTCSKRKSWFRIGVRYIPFVLGV